MNVEQSNQNSVEKNLWRKELLDTPSVQRPLPGVSAGRDGEAIAPHLDRNIVRIQLTIPMDDMRHVHGTEWLTLKADESFLMECLGLFTDGSFQAGGTCGRIAPSEKITAGL